jgi:hypothetical protein
MCVRNKATTILYDKWDKGMTISMRFSNYRDRNLIRIKLLAVFRLLCFKDKKIRSR